MAALTKQTVGAAGTDITYASAAAGGDTVANATAADALLILNGDASPTTITVVVPGNLWNGQAAPDTTYSLGAGETGVLRLDPRYNSSGVTSITYSSVTSLSIAAITL